MQGLPASAARAQPRVIVDAASWTRAGQDIASGQGTLLSLWGDVDTVHLAALEEGQIGILTFACALGRFPSIGRFHPPALRLERTICDLYGLQAEDPPDTRRWLDHGRWGARQPLGKNPPAPSTGDPYAFRPVEGGHTGSEMGRRGGRLCRQLRRVFRQLCVCWCCFVCHPGRSAHSRLPAQPDDPSQRSDRPCGSDGSVMRLASAWGVSVM